MRLRKGNLKVISIHLRRRRKRRSYCIWRYFSFLNRFRWRHFSRVFCRSSLFDLLIEILRVITKQCLLQLSQRVNSWEALRKRDLLGHKRISLEVHSLDMRNSIKCLHWSQLRKRSKCWWTLRAKLSHLPQSLELSHCVMNRNWRKRDIWEFWRSFSRSTWLTFCLCHYLELLWSDWSLALFGLEVIWLYDLWFNLNRIVSLMQFLKLQESIALCLFILPVSLEFFRDKFLERVHRFFSIFRYTFFAIILSKITIGLMSAEPLIVSW